MRLWHVCQTKRSSASTDSHTDMFKSMRGSSKGVDGSGVAAVILEPPHEAWRVLGNRVDAVEIVDEVGHARVVERIADASDIQLGEVKHRHGAFSALLHRHPYRLPVRAC